MHSKSTECKGGFRQLDPRTVDVGSVHMHSLGLAQSHLDSLDFTGITHLGSLDFTLSLLISLRLTCTPLDSINLTRSHSDSLGLT